MATETKAISNSADIIDVRDIIERVEELHALGAVGSHAVDNEDHTEEDEELHLLEELLGDLQGNGGDYEWQGHWYPVSLIRDSYWEDDCREFAEDMHGEAIRNAAWPMNCIDWTQAANERQMDYSSVEFDDVTYWYR